MPSRIARFDWGRRTYVMGILNLTPDSFSGDGIFSTAEQDAAIQKALDQARRFAAAGVDILDVGGESTRPGAQPVPEEVERARVIPVIRALAAEFDLPISIDTYKARLAEAALEAGAGMVNDVWGLRGDPNMAAVVAAADVPVVLMHNRLKTKNVEIQKRLGGRFIGVRYQNLIQDVQRELMECVALAHAAGIRDENIILDPGLGFGKTVAQSLTLINRLDAFRSLGYPLLIGPSRKSFIGYTLDLPPDQRVEGTAAAVAIGIARGADIVRVHDVAPIVRVARMADAIVRTKDGGTDSQ